MLLALVRVVFGFRPFILSLFHIVSYDNCMAEPAKCTHPRRRLIAKDKDAEYVECLDCGAILEADELPESSGFNESLSDA